MTTIEQVKMLIRNSYANIADVMNLLIEKDGIGFWDNGGKVVSMDEGKYIFLKADIDHRNTLIRRKRWLESFNLDIDIKQVDILYN